MKKMTEILLAGIGYCIQFENKSIALLFNAGPIQLIYQKSGQDTGSMTGLLKYV